MSKIELVGAVFNFVQENDSCDSGNNGQVLQITIEDAGGGHYFVIKTERWAADDHEDIAKVLDELRNRLGDWWQS